MYTNEIIRQLRRGLRMTQKDLADHIGVSTLSVRNWELGTKIPSTSAIISLAKLFNVSTDYLLGISDELISNGEMSFLSQYRSLDSYKRGLINIICEYSANDTTEKRASDIHTEVRKPERYIPKYLNPAAAGYSSPLDGDDFEMIRVDDSVPAGADFAVRIQGNSMTPYLHDGDTVYIKRTDTIRNGSIGIFNVYGSTYCKLFHTDSLGNTTLISTNEAFAKSNIFLSADSDASAICFGVVIGYENIQIPSYFTD